MAFKVKLPQMDCGGVYRYSFLYWAQDAQGARIPVDLTGYTAEMEIRKGATLIAELSTGNGYLTISGNEISINIPANVTKNYSFAEADYDLMILPAADPAQAERLVYGKITGVKVVTQL